MSKPITIIDDGLSRVQVYSDWLNNADACFEKLQQEVEWQHRKIILFGKEHSIPRQESWVGEQGVGYQYSGHRYIAAGWPECLANVPAQIEKAFGWKANSALLNFYTDGQNSMGWHSDDEPELGHNPTIMILSVGEPRTFQMRHKKEKQQKHAIELAHGSLLIMSKETQHHWQHAIPKRAKIKQPRISCTFRKVLV
ncbi:alpha-ketoglutarate-dependent dioxygenase AlkB [Reinekea marina]|uniref:Alpha-ketoglutarate-dependent dioxygenase AlkB family protein n=1 Tax=Reinekea marina TaxID=1310421 RepID=A0ABV7WLK4_9GAMM|nr:alpha-ketoglutarate-dependent dioxygenase AlkB [Reinekea marina]MDN3648305.1 alpha-ketoglutarate-dependent dioxygenase AlkB [Reinekea marina]